MQPDLLTLSDLVDPGGVLHLLRLELPDDLLQGLVLPPLGLLQLVQQGTFLLEQQLRQTTEVAKLTRSD